ncbi:hypothetical protein UFOVP349_25 [uncultured Caudovirales phage]|uniref:Uncharacterized protein n=1 Tax=uncultured Caudovirales phage TaxID=2100421 RepID=A0A6J5M2K9_9CAUD|nr:hypothetical protein UFOVP349_25 [uncultured Caudovirales phage]
MQSMVAMMGTFPATNLIPMAKTRKPEVTGPYPELARLSLEITGDVTRRQAEIRVGGAISHVAIARLWAGEQVTEGTVLRFAQGYGVDPNPLLEAAGYPPLPTRQVSPSIPVNGESDAGEIERVSDSQEPEAESRLKWMAAYDHLPFKIRESMLAQAEAILEAQYQGRTDIVGKRQK